MREGTVMAAQTPVPKSLSACLALPGSRHSQCQLTEKCKHYVAYPSEVDESTGNTYIVYCSYQRARLTVSRGADDWFAELVAAFGNHKLPLSDSVRFVRGGLQP